MSSELAPIIVTALLGNSDFAVLDGLRRAHFPPERNVLSAHLTLFHHLPPSMADEIKHRLAVETSTAKAPPARLSKLMSLGRGVAFGVDCEALSAIRERLADAFSGMLIPQDQQPWRPHITIQNKVAPAEAKALLQSLSQDFRPRPLRIAGLASHYYRGGPWEPLSRHMFRQ